MVEPTLAATLQAERASVRELERRTRDRAVVERLALEAEVDAARSWARHVGWLPIGVSVAALGCLTSGAVALELGLLELSAASALGLGYLIGPRHLLARAGEVRSALAVSMHVFTIASAIVGSVPAVLLVMMAPAGWLCGPNEFALPSRAILVVLGGLVAAFLLARALLRSTEPIPDAERDTAAGLTWWLSAVAAAAALVQLPSLVGAWLEAARPLDEKLALSAFLPPFVPLVGLLRTRAGPRPQAHAMALGSSLLAALLTAGLCVSVGELAHAYFFFGAFGCAALGLVLSDAVLAPEARAEAKLINAVACAGAVIAGLAVG